MENQQHIPELFKHFESSEKHLLFCKDELDTFDHRLSEVVKQNNTKEILAEVEHFQNQFIRQREVIDELKHDLKAHEHQLAENVKENPIASDRRLVPLPSQLLEDLNTFQHIYQQLKVDFQTFLSSVL